MSDGTKKDVYDSGEDGVGVPKVNYRVDRSFVRETYRRNRKEERWKSKTEFTVVKITLEVCTETL